MNKICLLCLFLKEFNIFFIRKFLLFKKKNVDGWLFILFNALKKRNSKN